MRLEAAESAVIPWGPGNRFGVRMWTQENRDRYARSQSNRGDYRFSERQERRKRGASIDPHGYDAGKKIKGKKRHLLVDAQGLMLQAIVHAADIQDRDGGAMLLAALFGMFPFLLK